MKALIFIAIVFCVYKIIRTSADRNDAEQEAVRAEEERRNIILEQTRIKEEIRADRERAKEMTRRQIESERQRLAWQQRQDKINRQAAQDREKLRKEQERQAAQLAKHEEQIRKAEFVLNQTREDIDNILYKMEEAQQYSMFLEEQRDKCVPGSAEYFKWQNKLSANDDKIYKLDTKRRKAAFQQSEAQRKLA